MTEKPALLGVKIPYIPRSHGEIVIATAYVVIEMKDHEAYAVTKHLTEADIRKKVADGTVPIQWREPPTRKDND